MIESDKKSGSFELMCDFCEESEWFDSDGDFMAFIKEAKEIGWTMKKEKGGWEHKCPGCSKEI